MTTPAEHAAGLKLAKRMAKRLLQQYLRFSPPTRFTELVEDRYVSREIAGAWYWTWDGARDAYYEIVRLWRLKREA